MKEVKGIEKTLTFNRTIEELKLTGNPGFPIPDNSFNRTIEELKLLLKLFLPENHYSLLIAPRELKCLKSKGVLF